mgnify:CR=1 FL=1
MHYFKNRYYKCNFDKVVKTFELDNNEYVVVKFLTNTSTTQDIKNLYELEDDEAIFNKKDLENKEWFYD